MRNAFSVSLFAVFLAVATVPLRAADAPAQTPASAPAAAVAPPHKVEVPKNFKVVTLNNRNVICDPADEAWVVTALNKVKATTRPATLPATLLQNLVAQRDNILRQVAIDLGLRDLVQAAKMYDQDLVGAVRTLDEYKPKVFYFAASPEQMAAAMRAGWTDPHFYYNRAADAVTFNPIGLLIADRPEDDVLFPAAFEASFSVDKRSEALSVAIGQFEASIQASLEIRGRTTVGVAFAEMVNEVGAKPLGLKDDQSWFGFGIANILSAKYTGMITGESASGLMDMLTIEIPNNPLKSSAVDLMHPPDVKNMREEAVPAYQDAFRRKAARAVRFLLDKGGAQAIPKAVNAVRDKKPADGTAMVNEIKAATGVDTTPLLVMGS